MSSRRAAVVLTALTSVLVLGAVPGTAHAAKPALNDTCEDVNSKNAKGADSDCDYD
ncbi:MAG: hypothetical protein WD794_12625 [Mycobacteriales bacterium]